MITEEQVASKVSELMETLDHIKKYTAIAKSLKGFIVIIGVSVAVFLAFLTVFEIYGLERVLNSPVFFVVAFLTLLIPLVGLVCGMLYMRRQINGVEQGEWRSELAQGFSATLKLLVELDWEKTLEDVSIAKLGYAIYSLLKTGVYLLVLVAAFELAWNGLTLIFLRALVPVGAVFWGFIAVLVVVFVLGGDLVRRYRELYALDMLVWELRWFRVEFERAEFQA